MPKIVARNIEGSLRDRIAAGEWSSSGRLPAERDLAAEYGVARNTVRRAVEAIANEGTVARQIGRGTFLNGGTSELATIIQRVTGVSPADLMAVRLIVEPQAAAIAAKNASLSDLQAIADAHQQATQALQTENSSIGTRNFINGSLPPRAMSCWSASTASSRSSAAAIPGSSSSANRSQKTADCITASSTPMWSRRWKTGMRMAPHKPCSVTSKQSR